jgi:mRNA-degrading endonuclease RelE of RelBE toxin-antitoxin system
MSYELNFTDRGEETLNRLNSEEKTQVKSKLTRIANCPYRHPTDWDFKQMEGCADGRLRITDGLRAFADIDDRHKIIWIRKIGRRENLYT